MFSFWQAKQRQAESKRHGRSTRAKAPPRRPQLCIEQLEDRWLPSSISLIQNIGTASAAGGRSLSITAPAQGVAAGDTIILEVATIELGLAVSANVTDAAGNTYTKDADVGFMQGRTLVFSAPVGHALKAGDVITITLGGTDLNQGPTVASAAEFGGLLAANPVDQTAMNGSAGMDPSSGTTASPTSQANELLIGAIFAGLPASLPMQGPPPATFTPGAGYTALASPDNTALFATLDLEAEYQITSAVGTYQANGTFTDSRAWRAALVTYKAAPPTVLNTIVVHTDGSLTEFDSSGASHLLSPAGTIIAASAVTDGTDATVVFAITTGAAGAQYQNTLWKFANGAWSEMSGGFFQQISAATNSTGQAVVFGVIGQGDAVNTNALFEQSNAFGPVGLNTGFRLLSPAGTIQSISAVTDRAGNDVVYAIAASGNNLWEHSPAFSGDGWQKLSTGAFAQVSAGLNASGQAVAYGVLTNHQLWEQNPMFGPTGVDRQFRQLSGMNGLPASFLSVAAGNADVVFGVAADHTVWEHSPPGNIQLSSMLLANQLSATQMQPGLEEVFMALTDGSFWEFSTAFPTNNPFKELFTSGAATSTTPG
jgi:hypothetical protein